jgi:hypothetical protein
MRKLFRVEVGTEDNQSESTEGLLFIDPVINYYDENDKRMEEWEVKEYFNEMYGEEVPDLVDNKPFHSEQELKRDVVKRLHLLNEDCVEIV